MFEVRAESFRLHRVLSAQKRRQIFSQQCPFHPTCCAINSSAVAVTFPPLLQEKEQVSSWMPLNWRRPLLNTKYFNLAKISSLTQTDDALRSEGLPFKLELAPKSSFCQMNGTAWRVNERLSRRHSQKSLLNKRKASKFKSRRSSLSSGINHRFNSIS